MTIAADVVVPTYGRAASLARLLEALSHCRRITEARVIIVDDGSPDATASIAADAPIPVCYLRQENSGPAAARNRGAGAGTAPLVIFVDDDCVPDPGWIADYLDAFARTPQADALGGRIVPLVNTAVTRFVQAEGLVGHGGSGPEVRFLVSANLGIRRAAFEAVGGFDEAFPLASAEDVEFSMRLLATGHSLDVLDGAMVAHDHPGRWGEVLATYGRHGRGRIHLAEAHPEALTAIDAHRALSAAYWRARYARYRADAGPARALAYSLGRMVGLLAMAIGARSERSLRRAVPEH